MQFDSLRVKYVRNISGVHIEPDAGLNLIVGPNASGKTALLESIYLLARARSFRTPRIKDVIQHQHQLFTVAARITCAKASGVATGIEKGYGSTSIRYNGKTLRTVSEQASNIPLILITPDTQALVTGSPRDRRHWLDWALFHVEPTYIETWRTYQKSLRNRNNLLKKGGDIRQITSWEAVMLESATCLDELRTRFVEKLQEQLAITLDGVFTHLPQLVFYNGCPAGLSLEGHLENRREKDRLLGYTRHGPHKADVRFLAETQPLSTIFSRGQVKRFVIGLLISQALAYRAINGEKPVFLIDDYGAELDVQARQSMLKQVSEYGGQAFLTTTELDEDLKELSGAALFHVEHGEFNKVVK